MKNQYLYVLLMLLLSASASSNILYDHGHSDDGDAVFHSMQSGMVILMRTEGVLFSLDTAFVSHHGDPEWEPGADHQNLEWIWRWDGANDVQPEVYQLSETKLHHYDGKDTANWRINTSLAEKVIYKNLYDGIDLLIYSKGSSFKYDWIIHPGGDPNVIQWHYEGRDSWIENDKIILKDFGVGDEVPFSYQLESGVITEVPSVYQESEVSGHYKLNVGDYDRSKKLICDPEIAFASYGLDGIYFDHVSDSTGHYVMVYIMGFDEGFNTPIDLGGVSQQRTGVYRMTLDLSAVDYLIVLSASSSVSAVALDKKSDSLVLSGGCDGSDWFTTSGVFQEEAERGVFLIVIAEDGQEILSSSYTNQFDNVLTFNGRRSLNAFDISTYQGPGVYFNQGSDEILVVSNVYSGGGGDIEDFYNTMHYGPTNDRVSAITSFSSDLTQLNWSLFLSVDDACREALDTELGPIRRRGANITDLSIHNGVLYVCGVTECPLPFLNSEIDAVFDGEENGFLLAFDLSTLELLNGTYMHTTFIGQTVDLVVKNDEVFVSGFGIGYDSELEADYSFENGLMFVNVYDLELTSLKAHYRFGTNDMGEILDYQLAHFVVDDCGNFYLSVGMNSFCNGGVCDVGMQGWQEVEGFLQEEGYQWLLGFNRQLNEPIFAGYLGGGQFHLSLNSQIVDDKWVLGVCREGGYGPLANMPVTNDAFMSIPGPNHQPHLTVIDLGGITGEWLEANLEEELISSCQLDSLTLRTSSEASAYQWFLDGEEIGATPELVFADVLDGFHDVQLVISDPTTCNATDTAFLQIEVPVTYSNLEASWTLDDPNPCSEPQWYDLSADVAGASSYFWTDPDGEQTFNQTELSYFLEGEGSYVFEFTAEDAACDSTLQLTHQVDLLPVINYQGTDFTVLNKDECGREVLEFSYHASGVDESFWTSQSETGSGNPWQVELESGYQEIELTLYNAPCDQSRTELIEVYVSEEDFSSWVIQSNVITPNGDQKNDSFNPYFGPKEGYTANYILHISNRWGQEVFSTDDPSKAWNGRIEGEPVSAGTYFYTLEFMNLCTDEQENYQGVVTVVFD